jgi:hypothetical protein
MDAGKCFYYSFSHKDSIKKKLITMQQGVRLAESGKNQKPARILSSFTA